MSLQKPFLWKGVFLVGENPPIPWEWENGAFTPGYPPPPDGAIPSGSMMYQLAPMADGSCPCDLKIVFNYRCSRSPPSSPDVNCPVYLPTRSGLLGIYSLGDSAGGADAVLQCRFANPPVVTPLSSPPPPPGTLGMWAGSGATLFGWGPGLTGLMSAVSFRFVVWTPGAAYMRAFLQSTAAGQNPVAPNGISIDGPDFTFVDLGGEDYSNLNLLNGDFTGAILTDTNFSGSKFNGAVFSYCNMKGAHFSNATLVGVTFTNCDLTDARFDGVDLSNRDLSTCTLTRACFKGATLSNVDFSGTPAALRDLGGVDFTGASLDGADLSYTDVTRATFSPGPKLGTTTATTKFVHAVVDPATLGSTWNYCDLSYATIRNQEGLATMQVSARDAILRGVVLDGAVLNKADFTDAKMFGCNLTQCELRSAIFEGAQLQADSPDDAAVLSNALLNDADFKTANLTGVNLSGAFLWGDAATLEGAVVIDTNFANAYLTGLDFTAVDQNSCRGAMFDGACLINSNFEGTDLSESDKGRVSFVGACLQGANFDHAKLDGADISNAAVAQASGTKFSVTIIMGLWPHREPVTMSLDCGVTAGMQAATNDKCICPDGSNGPCGPQQQVAKDPPTQWPPGADQRRAQPHTR